METEKRTLLFHGSGSIVQYPEIRKTKYTKDFSWGFYCTNNQVQAQRWAQRYGESGVINRYVYQPHAGLRVLSFAQTSDEWLDFVAHCRAGGLHEYDIVEGPMADDTVWNYVNDFLAENISREAFWALAKFRHPTHQISFHTIRALDCLSFEGVELLYG